LPEPGTRAHYRAVSDFQFAELERLARDVGPRPRLVVAHVTVPHEPYVYAADGSYVTAEQEAARSRATNTLDQVRFVNDRLEHLVDLLVSGDPATDPIIVIQSDEGPHPARQEELGPAMDWFTATEAERAEKLRTLSAWYLPGIDEEPPEDITGVNTWRWILDRYLGTEFGLLPDRVWVYRDQDHAYDYREVTDEFE